MRKTKHIITILILLIILLSFSYKVIAAPTIDEKTVAEEGKVESVNNNQDASQNSSEFGDTAYIPTSIKRVDGENVYKVHASHSKKNGVDHDAPGDPEGWEVLVGTIGTESNKYITYRANDTKLQRTMAYIAADLANNDHIGYDYGGTSMIDYFRKHNYNPGEITEDCVIDCSAFISAALEGAFAKMGKQTKVGRMSTDGMAGDLPKYGFTKVIGGEEPSALARSGQLQIGDILVAPGHHTFIFLGPYYTVGKTAPASSGTYGEGGATGGGYTAVGEEIDDRQNLDDKNFRFQGFPGEVTYEGEVSIIRNFFEKIGDFIDYLLGLIFLIIKVVIIGFVNIAYNIFLSIVSFMKK